MGDNTLATVQDGTVGNPEQVNQYKTALSGPIVPRNAQGEAEDLSAPLGQSDNKFSSTHTQILDLYGNIRKQSTHVAQEYTSNDTFTIPDGVYNVRCLCAGGGGGGGRSTGGGFVSGGGGGACTIYDIDVSSGTTIQIFVGAGGSGGASDNTSGSAGGDSYVQLDTVEQCRASGGLGGPYATVATGNTGVGGGASALDQEKIVSMASGGSGARYGTGLLGSPATGGFAGRGGNDGRSGGGGSFGNGGTGATSSGNFYMGGGGGYANGSSGSVGSAGSGGAGRVILSYDLPDGVVDPN